MAPVEWPVERHHVGLHAGVLQDMLVDQALDFFDFRLVHSGVMREIEAQARRFDHAACLFDVRSQHLAQRRVQQVGRGMVTLGGSALGFGDFRAKLIAQVDGGMRSGCDARSAQAPRDRPIRRRRLLRSAAESSAPRSPTWPPVSA